MTEQIIHGDCLQVMKFIPDKSIDAIISDPPYGTTACKWDTIIPFEPLWEQYKRIIKDNGAIVLTSSQPFTSALVMSNIKMFKYELIWDKVRPFGFLDSKFRPMKKHENIAVFSNAGCSNGSKPPMKYFPQGLKPYGKINRKSPSNILNSEPKNNSMIAEFTGYPSSILCFAPDKNIGHPTQKPVALFEYLIKTYTNEGDLVLDNCAGSGTTGVACKNLNRNYILIEKEEQYIKIIKERLK